MDEKASGVSHTVDLPDVLWARSGSPGAQRSGKTWDGLHATQFRPASEKISVPALANHLVVLHLGPPASIAQRVGGGRMIQRLVERGASAVMPAGQASEWRWDSLQGGKADSLHLYLAPALVREAAESAGLDPEAVEIVGGLGPLDPQVERIGLALLSELYEEEPLGERIFGDALAKALAVHLVRKRSTLGRRARRVASHEPEGGLSRLVLKRATDYVGDNISGKLTLEEISRAANISPYHFSRLFKESTGLSPHQYVIRERVEKAKALLVATEIPLHEVASRSGFADQSHMGRHLKRLLGVSPTRLRSG